MLDLISSIPTTVREGFDVQDLPLRAVPLTAEQMNEVFGACPGRLCVIRANCCAGYYCRYLGRVPFRRPICTRA